MFVADTYTLLVEALQNAFDAEYPYPEMRGVPVHIEYPLDEAAYPGIYVNFVTTGDVRCAGIGHVEWTLPGDDGGIRRVERWLFSGVAEFTVHCLGNLERARFVDELSKVIAFGRPGSNALGDFRRTIEHNDLIGLTAVFGSFTVGGWAETPGTPWQTDDVIYEATLSLTLEGEVLYDPEQSSLLPLEAIRITNWIDGTEDDPTTPVTGVQLGDWV